MQVNGKKGVTITWGRHGGCSHSWGGLSSARFDETIYNSCTGQLIKEYKVHDIYNICTTTSKSTVLKEICDPGSRRVRWNLARAVAGWINVADAKKTIEDVD